MDSTACSRNLLLAIEEFYRVHSGDDRFADVVRELGETQDRIADLVPSAKQKPGETPGQRDAREIAEESRSRSKGADEDDESSN
jgi:hypothetical protein